MKKISRFLAGFFCVTPLAANAAGTYYNGAYQSPQQRYNTTGYAQQQQEGYIQRGYTAPQGSYSSSGYSRYQPVQQQQVQQQPAQKQQRTASSTQNGFYLDGGISRETAEWQFEMKESGSMLHYDNIAWNVFDVNAGYVFDAGNTALQIGAGLKFGFQGSESTMVDDDITNGGYFITQWVDNNTQQPIGDQMGHALSIGTSSGGSMFGYNVDFGLKDFFKLGNTKITPSIGWRSLSYTLETKNNYGLSVDTLQTEKGCLVPGGEEQCDPVIIVYFYDGAGKRQDAIIIKNTNNEFPIPTGYDFIDPSGTYYYHQPDISHSYDVSWDGPYLALDMVYDINQNNSVNAHVEFGLPGYSATGDQPYRFDWQHPKSVEDKAGIGSAMNLGFGANWQTALTNSVMLSVGLTYNYYTVSGANAKTYLNENFYTDIYNSILQNDFAGDEAAMLDPDDGNPVAINIKNLETSCPGWVCNADNEVDSFYKSMGIRVGLAAKF